MSSSHHDKIIFYSYQQRRRGTQYASVKINKQKGKVEMAGIVTLFSIIMHNNNIIIIVEEEEE